VIFERTRTAEWEEVTMDTKETRQLHHCERCSDLCRAASGEVLQGDD